MSDTTDLLQPATPPLPAAPASPAEPATADAAPPDAEDQRRRALAERPAFGLPHVSSAEIRAELRRRESRVAQLLEERERIVAEMDQLEAQLELHADD